MSFADNLKQIRRDKGLSQEDLAELLDVSRQAVSKWEQGIGYPEVEKLLVLSNRLNISLDGLMAAEIAKETSRENPEITGKLIITSPNENVIVNCYKVVSSQKMKGRKDSPKYALFGVSSEASSYWGEPTTFLGWYAQEEDIANEISGIQNAILKGIPSYELKYSVKVERHGLSMKIVQEKESE
ncbi:helix-turn-helix transcriptional regulator [Anaerolentibacter hominis]|uniref:helix-turn-helix domain-containing protein n=1 Tax=Anaerolentibacter hominis TaxID=3079009 RepID=UPI0031B897BF